MTHATRRRRTPLLSGSCCADGVGWLLLCQLVDCSGFCRSVRQLAQRFHQTSHSRGYVHHHAHHLLIGSACLPRSDRRNQRFEFFHYDPESYDMFDWYQTVDMSPSLGMYACMHACMHVCVCDSVQHTFNLVVDRRNLCCILCCVILLVAPPLLSPSVCSPHTASTSQSTNQPTNNRSTKKPAPTSQPASQPAIGTNSQKTNGWVSARACMHENVCMYTYMRRPRHPAVQHEDVSRAGRALDCA